MLIVLTSFILPVVVFGKDVSILLLSNATVANNKIRLRINCHRNQKVRRKSFQPAIPVPRAGNMLEATKAKGP